MDYQELIALAKKKSTHISLDRDLYAYGTATNASCGDVCEMWTKVEDGNVTAVDYDAKGCVMSRAAAAVLARAAIGPIGRIGPMSGNSMRELLGADISPLRERCLTTALVALQNAVNSYEA